MTKIEFAQAVREVGWPENWPAQLDQDLWEALQHCYTSEELDGLSGIESVNRHKVFAGWVLSNTGRVEQAAKEIREKRYSRINELQRKIDALNFELSFLRS